MDPQAYRELMRHQAGAVTLISTGVHGNRTGLIATAVCSLTDTPPTLLMCVNESASAHDLIAEKGSFCVNLLCQRNKQHDEEFNGKTEIAGEAGFYNTLLQTKETGEHLKKNENAGRRHDGTYGTFKVLEQRKTDRLILLQGMQEDEEDKDDAAAWSVTLHIETGRMSIAVSGEEAAYALFGNCHEL